MSGLSAGWPDNCLQLITWVCGAVVASEDNRKAPRAIRSDGIVVERRRESFGRNYQDQNERRRSLRRRTRSASNEILRWRLRTLCLIELMTLFAGSGLNLANDFSATTHFRPLNYAEESPIALSLCTAIQSSAFYGWRPSRLPLQVCMLPLSLIKPCLQPYSAAATYPTPRIDEYFYILKN